MNIQLSLTVALSTAILYSIHSTANEHISSYLNYHFPSQRFILFFSFHCYNTILRTLRTILCFVTSSLFFAFFRIEFSVYSSIYTLVYDMIDLWCAFDLVCFSIFAVYILFFRLPLPCTPCVSGLCVLVNRSEWKLRNRHTTLNKEQYS